jgi:hypothetical protein
MKRRARELAAIAVAAGLGASSTFCGGAAFESASSDDGGAPNGSDGAPNGTDGSPNGTDGGGPGTDAPSGSEGGGAEAGLDANAPFSCATESTFLFCADFDTGASPGTGWSQPPLAFGGGTNAFDTAHYRSAPRGYAASTPASTAATGASLVATVASGAPNVEYAFSFYVTKLDTSFQSYATIARLAIGQPRQILLDMQLDANGLHLVQTAPQPDGGETTSDDVVRSTVTTGSWTHVRLTLDRSTSPGTVHVVIDETAQHQFPALGGTIDAKEVEADLGILYAKPPNGGDSFTFDDAIVRGL